jgi:hypothetical protein
MITKTTCRIMAVLGLSIGFLFSALAVHLVTGAVVIMPISFLFGMGEMDWYESTAEALTNLWWHVAPGLVGGALGLLSVVVSGMFVAGGLLLWEKSSSQPT